jgi:hypothetical protein
LKPPEKIDVREQIVTPIDQRAHRLMARQRTAVPRGEHAKTLVELLREFRW